MIVYVKSEGVLGITVSNWNTGYVVKWYIDGMEHEEFLLEEEYIIYRQGSIGGLDVI